MTPRLRVCLLGMALVSLLASRPVLAISPSYVMFYGDNLATPIVASFSLDQQTSFLWLDVNPGYWKKATPKDVEGRPYVKYAIFWGRWNPKPSSPDAASQHGRFYLPTATQPGVAVMTPAVMEEDGQVHPDHPNARPVPTDTAGFTHGWLLTATDVRTAKALGVPGL